MSRIVKRLEQLSAWIEYTLVTTLIDPPVLRVRLRPTDAFDVADSLVGVSGIPVYGRALLTQALNAIAEVDLVDLEGKPVVLMPENREAALRDLLTEKVDGRGTMLGIVVVEDSKKRELFLKN